jgi:hypothetical protein
MTHRQFRGSLRTQFKGPFKREFRGQFERNGKSFLCVSYVFPLCFYSSVRVIIEAIYKVVIFSSAASV